MELVEKLTQRNSEPFHQLYLVSNNCYNYLELPHFVLTTYTLLFANSYISSVLNNYHRLSNLYVTFALSQLFFLFFLEIMNYSSVIMFVNPLLAQTAEEESHIVQAPDREPNRSNYPEDQG